MAELRYPEGEQMERRLVSEAAELIALAHSVNYQHH